MAKAYSEELQSLLRRAMEPTDGPRRTKVDVAQAAGLSPNTVGSVVNRGAVASSDVLRRIADALDLDPIAVLSAAGIVEGADPSVGDRSRDQPSTIDRSKLPFEALGATGNVPLVGSAPCGLAELFDLSQVDADWTLVDELGATLAIRVKGDSMPPYEVGDILLIRAATTPYRTGRNYIVDIDGEITCKRLKLVEWLGEGQGDRYTLISTRNGSAPIVASSENARLLCEVVRRLVND